MRIVAYLLIAFAIITALMLGAAGGSEIEQWLLRTGPTAILFDLLKWLGFGSVPGLITALSFFAILALMAVHKMGASNRTLRNECGLHAMNVVNLGSEITSLKVRLGDLPAPLPEPQRPMPDTTDIKERISYLKTETDKTLILVNELQERVEDDDGEISGWKVELLGVKTLLTTLSTRTELLEMALGVEQALKSVGETLGAINARLSLPDTHQSAERTGPNGAATS